MTERKDSIRRSKKYRGTVTPIAQVDTEAHNHLFGDCPKCRPEPCWKEYAVSALLLALFGGSAVLAMIGAWNVLRIVLKKIGAWP